MALRQTAERLQILHVVMRMRARQTATRTREAEKGKAALRSAYQLRAEERPEVAFNKINVNSYLKCIYIFTNISPD